MLPTGELAREFEAISEHWSPRVIADANGQFVKLAKVKGEFVWHAHAKEDEFFLVYRGTFVLRFRDGSEVVLREGDFHVVPRGVELAARSLQRRTVASTADGSRGLR